MKIFENIVGQPQVVSILEKAIQASRNSEDDKQEMTHAWLFAGPPGSGKSVAAMAFAAALVCPNDGCGECIDCKTAINGSHLDIEIFKTESLSIKIDEVRELISRSSTSPSISSWRIVLIQDIQRLTEAAANALLKAIEEPSSRTVWMLTATSSIEVLPTVRSRCRYIQLKMIKKEMIVELLTKRYKVDIEVAEQAARVSQGNIGRAKYLSANPHLLTRRNELIDSILSITNTSGVFMMASKIIDSATIDTETDLEVNAKKVPDIFRNLLEGSGKKSASGNARVIKELENVKKSRASRAMKDSLDRALLDISSLYRDVLIVQSGNPEQIINEDFKERIIKLSEELPPEIILANIEKVVFSIEKIPQNASNLLLLEDFLMSLNRPW